MRAHIPEHQGQGGRRGEGEGGGSGLEERVRGAVLNSGFSQDPCWECSRIPWEAELCPSSISRLYSPC